MTDADALISVLPRPLAWCWIKSLTAVLIVIGLLGLLGRVGTRWWLPWICRRVAG